MFIYHQQVLQTLDILCANHQKVIDNYDKRDPLDDASAEELMQVMNSLHALEFYNCFKQRYQNN